jgi:Anti-sigma factor NepR
MTLPNDFPHSANHNGPIDGQPEKRETANGLVADTDALTQALRQSFQATVEEAVPDSLMDLINKLK